MPSPTCNTYFMQNILPCRARLCHGEGGGNISQWLFFWAPHHEKLVGVLEIKPLKNVGVPLRLKTMTPRNFSFSCYFTLSLQQFVKITIVFLPVDGSSGFNSWSHLLYQSPFVSVQISKSWLLLQLVFRWIQVKSLFFILSRFFLS